MKRLTVLALLLLALAPARAQDKPALKLPTISLEEFKERRLKLMKQLGDGPLVIEADPLLKGEAGIDGNTPRYDYAYLTGYHREGDVMVLVPSEKTTLIFSKEPDGLREKTGADHVFPAEKFADFARDVLAGADTIYTRVRKANKELIEESAPEADLRSSSQYIQRSLVRMRVVKSAGEVEMIRKASDATNKAHLAAMKALKPGMNEGDIQKIIEDVFKAEGCDGLAFPTICGSGKNGTILHYMRNNQEIPADSLIVCDIGASHRGYATDITRTLPTSGRFTKEHRAAYEAVLAAQKAAEDILKPGVTFGDLERAARKAFEELDRTDWSYAHSASGGPRHGLGHFVGLSVHDSGEYGRPLVAGNVITIEPGYYNVKEKYGIRIEDMYLVTEKGFERLSALPPRDPDEIEKWMAGK